MNTFNGFDQENKPNGQRRDEEASWSSVLWSAVVALIGFGFAAYRYLQFSGAIAVGENDRITRIERLLYRAAGMWGIIAVFLLMGIVGTWMSVNNYRAMKKGRK